MLTDLNTYLNKAIPDTRLTIKKYLDVKFEYLVSGRQARGAGWKLWSLMREGGQGLVRGWAWQGPTLDL